MPKDVHLLQLDNKLDEIISHQGVVLNSNPNIKNKWKKNSKQKEKILPMMITLLHCPVLLDKWQYRLKAKNQNSHV